MSSVDNLSHSGPLDPTSENSRLTDPNKAAQANTLKDVPARVKLSHSQEQVTQQILSPTSLSKKARFLQANEVMQDI